MKKLLSLILSLLMVCALLPVGVLAKPSPDDIAGDDEVTWRVWYRSEYGGELEVWDDFWVVRTQRDDREVIIVVRYVGDSTEVVVPEGVTHLPEGHFCNTETTTSITLPESLVGLGYESFCNMKNLQSVHIAGNIQKISEGTFGGCSSLQEVTLPDTLTWIDDGAFRGCTSLKHIELPEGLEIIDGNAFYNTGLTEITIPSTVTWMSQPFTSCEKLKKIVVTSPETELLGFTRQDIGNATIYAPKGSKAESAAKKAGIPFKAFALNKTTLSLSKDKSYQLKFNAGSDAVWKSSNSKVVSVDKNGKLTAKANGTATITATLYGKKYTCKVTVGAKTYTVKRGDTMWSIAAKQLGNGNRYTEIMKLNGMKNTSIKVGQKLKLPVK